MADGVIGWDAVLEGHLAAEQCKVLASARIGMAGAGGLGSNCAVFLARTGIRDFVIADPDVVALSNLNRQHFFPRHLGLPKVEALGAVLRELNPSVILRLEQRALDGLSACALFAGCDIVVEAVDDPKVKKNLVEALLLAGHRVVSASGMAGWGGIPMTARKLGSRLVVVGDHVRSWPRKPLRAPLRPRSPDPLANYPDWQRNGLTALVKAGVINSPDYWANKFGEAIKVGEIIGILGKMMEQPTE